MLDKTRFLTIGLVLAVAVVGCETEQDEAEISVNEERVQMRVEEGGEEPWNDWDVDIDGALNEEEWERWWQENNPFQDWDVDTDAITEEDWNARFDVDFGEVDENNDGVIDETEVRDGLYAAWDEDDSGTIEEDEWRGFDF